jgi:hypothetical protein
LSFFFQMSHHARTSPPVLAYVCIRTEEEEGR